MSFLRGATLTLGSAGQPFLPINIRGASGRKVMVNGIIPSDGGSLPPNPEFNSVTITGPDTESTTALKVVSGSVSAVNAYITDNISASKISVDNIADPQDSHVRCYSYEFRQEAEADGWNVTQLRPSVPPTPLDDMLMFSPAVSSAIIGVIPSDFNPNVSEIPNIILDPQTQALGGRIQCSGIVKCPKIAFGTESNETQHWTVQEDPPGNPESDNLVFRAPGSTSVFKIKDNSDITLLQQNSTQLNLNTNVILNSSSSLRFGAYSFKPQQYSLNRTLTIAATSDTTNFTNMAFNCRSDTWTNVNAGGSVSMYNALLEGFYRCTITQTGTSSAGNFQFCDIMFDYVLRLSTQTTPDIEITEPTYGYRKKPTNQARPTIEIDHLNTPVQSQPVFVLYSGQNSNETMPIEVRLTKLDF